MVWQLDLRRMKRGRLYFDTEEQAKLVRAAKWNEFEQSGNLFSDVSDSERMEFGVQRERYIPLGKTLNQIVDFFMLHHQGVTDKKLSVAIQECIEAKRESGKRDKYLYQLKGNLGRFLDAVTDKPISLVTPEECEKWVHNPKWSMVTRKGKKIDLGTLFSFAVRKGYCRINPIEKMEKIHTEDKPVGILTVDEARKVMETTRDFAPYFLPYMALCLFAGMRPAEVMRFKDWGHVNLEKGFVRVEGPKSKTRQSRLIYLEKNAIEWLKLAKDIGRLPIKNWQRQFDKVRDLAGIKTWPQDAMRHSYCSYSQPIRGSMKTAEYAGHSELTQIKDYRELVTDEDAVKFWAIRPGDNQAENKIVQMR